MWTAILFPMSLGVWFFCVALLVLENYYRDLLIGAVASGVLALVFGFYFIRALRRSRRLSLRLVAALLFTVVSVGAIDVTYDRAEHCRRFSTAEDITGTRDEILFRQQLLDRLAHEEPSSARIPELQRYIQWQQDLLARKETATLRIWLCWSICGLFVALSLVGWLLVFRATR
jgi:hypothetical protein